MNFTDKTYEDCPYSVFPSNYDFTDDEYMMDLQTEDWAKVKDYENALNSGDETSAARHFDSIENADRKVFTAEKWNKVRDAIRACQKFFLEEVQDLIKALSQKISDSYTAVEEKIKNILQNKGSYKSLAEYNVGDIVTYEIDGDTYSFLCTVNGTKGIDPTNTDNWTKLSIKGNPGEFNPRGEYDPNALYNKYDCIVYNGMSYIAIDTVKGETPEENPDKWKLFISGTGTSEATIYVSGLMSAADKKKLDGIDESANNYTHPTTAGNKHIPAGGSLNQILKWASDGTAQWASQQPLTLEINGDEEAIYDGSSARSLNITPKKIGSVPDYGVVNDVNDYVNTNEYCIIRWNINTLNSPYKDGITKLSSGLIIVSGTVGDTTMLGIPSGSNEIYIKSFADGFDKEPISDWTKIYPDKDVLRNYGSDIDVTNVNFDTLNEGNYLYNVHSFAENGMSDSLNQPNRYFGYGTLLSFFAEPYSKTQIYIPSLHSQWMMGLAVRTKYGEGEYTKWHQIPTCFFSEDQGYRALCLNGAGYDNDSELPINLAKGYYSVAAGLGTAADNYASLALGKFNREMTGGGSWGNTIGDAFVIGNGTSENARSNAFRVTYKGEVYGLSAFNTSGADYAEFIKEWFDGNPDNEDRVGYFVTIKNGFLHFANEGDYIAGITSGNPSVVGNADEDYYWRYERDEFNRIVYEDAEEEIEKTDKDGNITTIKTGNIIPNARMKLSENYDSERQKDYVERKNRPEWDYVGMVGVLPVRDDGTCEPDGFCKCGKNGIATKADTRTFDTFRVIGRINEKVISVILK